MANGETLTPKQQKEAQDAMQYAQERAALTSDSAIELNKLKNQMDRIDFGKDFEEASEMEDKMLKYANEYRTVLNEAQDDLNAYFNSLKDLLKFDLNKGKITPEEYEKQNKVLDIAQGMSQEAYIKNFNEFNRKMEEYFFNIGYQIDEAASAKFDNVGLVQQSFNELISYFASWGNNFDYEDSYDKIVLGDDLYNLIEKTNEGIEAAQIEPFVIPTLLDESGVREGLREIGATVIFGLRPLGLGISPVPTPRPTPRADGSHADGLDYVPFDGYIAQLHRGERVLTSRENEALSDSVVNDNSSAPITVNFSPIINTDGNSDSKIAEMLKSQIPDLVSILMNAIDERERNKRRTEYA